MESQWKEKTIGFLGDSITEGIGLETEERYWNLIDKAFGCKSYSYAKNGAVFSELKDQVLAMYDECGDKIDAVVVFAGTNDYYFGRKIGEWYSEPTEEQVVVGYDADMPRYALRKHRSFNTDIETFKGSINTVLSQIRELYPTKQIILITPIHRAYANFGGDNIQYDEMYANCSGYFFDEYIAAVKEAANVWACSLIDLNAASGLFPLNDVQAERFFFNTNTDRLHPGAKGHIRIAEAIVYYMKNIPVFE